MTANQNTPLTQSDSPSISADIQPSETFKQAKKISPIKAIIISPTTKQKTSLKASQLTRMPDGRRCVSEVLEVVGVRDDVYVTNTLFRLDRRSGFGFMREALNPAGDKLRREPIANSLG